MLIDKLAEVAQLKQQINSLNDSMTEAQNLHGQVQNLVNDGIIKQNPDGQLVEVDDAEERELIQINSGSKKRPGANGGNDNRRHAQAFGMNQLEEDPSSLMDDQIIS